ncbi:MAG: mechanosensitive ion channel [Xanthomonadales bacterium]|nr:mechanosensitive ion channel [Xanthomonadales bacterium]
MTLSRPQLFLQLATLVVLQLFCSAALAADQTELQLKLVEQRITTLQQQGATAEDSATLRAYRETLNWLREAQNFAQLTEQFQQEISSAPQDEAAVIARAQTASRPILPDMEKLERLSWAKLNDLASELRDASQSLVNKRESLDQQIAAEASNSDSIRTRLNSIDIEASALPQSHARFEMGGAPTQFEASQWQLAAHHRALDAERRALNAQLTNQPARSRMRRAERDELVRNIGTIQQELGSVEPLLASKRPALADQTLQQIPPDTPGYEMLQSLARENAALTDHRSQLATDYSRADAEKARTDGQLFELIEHYNSARRLVESGGRASVYGPYLMNYFMRLDQYHPPAYKLRQSNSISEIVVDRARHEQQLSELLDSEQFIQAQAEARSISQPLSSSVKKSAKQLVQDRRKLLTDLMISETELVQLLGKVDISYEQLDSLAKEFKAFLIGHILWVRSHLPMDRNFFKQVMQDIHQARESLQSSWAFSGRSLAIVALLAGLILLLLRRRMWRRVESINSRIGKPRNDSITYSLATLLLTLLRSAAIPLIMAGIALSIDNSQQGVLQPLALALLFASGGVMAAFFLRDATASAGICRVHFDWPENRCNAVTSLMTWTLVRLMPVVIIASFLVHSEQNTPHAVLGRLFLCVVAIMVALKIMRMLVRQRQLQPVKGFPPWMQDSVVISLTGFLLIIVLSGFLLPARIIYSSSAISALAFVVLLFTRELLMRWLLVTRRRIRFQQLVANQPGSEGEEKADKEARQASLGDISDSTAQLIKSLVYASGLLIVIMIWKPLMPAIQGLQRFSLWTVNQTVNDVQIQTQITLATMVLAVIIFITTFYAARRLPALIELIMRSSGKSTPATRYTVSTITNYVIIAIGTMVFFSTLKMSWSQLQWLVAALGVGIGFGLQEIVANFISGLIILFERPIRVGDVVTVGESSGTVTRIQIRATTIRDWDGKELLVPNKEFITGRLLNWTLSDTTTRIVIEVGIAYGSDVNKAMQILNDVVTAHPAVVADPRPNILFTQFGDNALQLSARCFLSDPEDRLLRVSELHQQIYTAFNDAGIVIAFPQLDVHMDPDLPLTVRLQQESAQPANS